MLTTLLIIAIVILIISVILALAEQKRDCPCAPSIVPGFLQLGFGVLIVVVIFGFMTGYIGIWIK